MVPSDKAAAITRVFKLFIRIVPPVACCLFDDPSIHAKPPDGSRRLADGLNLAGAIDPLAACLKHL